jgi:hypothetical protein
MKGTIMTDYLNMPPLPDCPFCGSADTFVERADFSSCYVICNACGARGPTRCNEVDADVAAEDHGAEPGEMAARRAWSARYRTEPVAAEIRATFEKLVPPPLCGESWEIATNVKVAIAVRLGDLRNARILLQSLPAVDHAEVAHG